MQTQTTDNLWRHTRPATLDALTNALRRANLAAMRDQRQPAHDAALVDAFAALRAELPEAAPTAPRIAGHGWDTAPARLH